MQWWRVVMALVAVLLAGGAGSSRAQPEQNQLRLPTSNSVQLPPWAVRLVKGTPGNERPCVAGRCSCTTPDVVMPDIAKGKYGIWSVTAEYVVVDGAFAEVVSLKGPNPYQGAPALTEAEAAAMRDAIDAAVRGARCTSMTGRALVTEGFGFQYSPDAAGPAGAAEPSARAADAAAAAPCSDAACRCTWPDPEQPIVSVAGVFRVDVEVALVDGVFAETVRMDGPARVGGGIVLDGYTKARIRAVVTDALKRSRCPGLPGRHTFQRTYNLAFR